MYSEVYISKKTSFLVILITVTAAFCLLSLPSWLNWESFKGIYELAVLIATAVAVFTYIRRRFYEYTYSVNGDVIGVTLKIGSRETTVCRFHVNDILKIAENAKISEIKKNDGVKTVSRCNGDLVGSSGTCIIYTDTEKNSPAALIFRPSAKFTEILQSKRIDNRKEL